MSVKFSEGLLKRFEILKDFQKKVIETFGEDKYNIFIFGSFATEDYVEGQSDIDIAVYYEREYGKKSRFAELAAFIETYFGELNINYDILYIDTNFVQYIYYIPLTSVLQVTDYYPDTLKAFCEKCKIAYETALRKEGKL